MRNPILGFILAAFCASLFAFSQNTKLKTLAENSWTLLDNAGPASLGRFAYSGGGYDPATHHFYLFGGGHGDGSANDVLQLDLSTMTWKSLYASDAASAYNCGNVSSATPGMLLSSGLPASRHTYDMIGFMEGLGKLIIWSGPTTSTLWSCPGQTLPADTWLFDPASNKWAYKNVSRGAQPAGESLLGEYDPIGGLYYAVDQSSVWTFNPSTDTWTKLANAANQAVSGVSKMLTYDPKHRRLWTSSRYFDLQTKTWTAISGGPGMSFADAYDAANDALVIYTGSSIYAYKIAQGQWETLTAAGAPDFSGEGNGPYGRFFYDPVDNAHLYVKSVGGTFYIYAYRYKGTSSSALQKTTSAFPKSAQLTATPNPFTAVVTLRLETGNRVTARYRIHDLSGRLIADLKPDNMGRCVWNARAQVPGVYFVTAKNGRTSLTRKLLLQR